MELDDRTKDAAVHPHLVGGGIHLETGFGDGAPVNLDPSLSDERFAGPPGSHTAAGHELVQPFLAQSHPTPGSGL